VIPKWFLILLFTYGIVLAGHILIGYSYALGFQISDFLFLPLIAMAGFLMVRKTYQQLSVAAYAQSVRIWLSWCSVLTSLITVVVLICFAKYSDCGFFHWQSEAAFGGSAYTLYIDRIVGLIVLGNVLIGLAITSLFHKNFTDLAVLSLLPSMLVIVFVLYIMNYEPNYPYPPVY
jgi:hypothetical protein